MNLQKLAAGMPRNTSGQFTEDQVNAGARTRARKLTNANYTALKGMKDRGD